MKLKINALRRRDMPSKFGGTWQIVSVKFDGIENPKFGFDLKGFSTKLLEKVKVGDVLEGYITKGSYQGKEGPVETSQFNKITAEYVYSLILKIDPTIETVVKEKVAPKSEWTATEEPTVETEDAGF